MALDSLSTAAQLEILYSDLLISTVESFNTDAFLQALSTVLDNGFQQGSTSLPNVDITTPAGSFNIVSSNDMLNTIAAECTTYWLNTIELTGTPVSCSSIASVTNTASSIHSLIIENLLSITGKVEPSLPYYKEFIDAIYNAIKTIQWTVSESGPSTCSTTHTVTII